jgi:hypothetical protein
MSLFDAEGHTVPRPSHALHHRGSGLEISQFRINAFGHQELTIYAEELPASLCHSANNKGARFL